MNHFASRVRISSRRRDSLVGLPRRRTSNRLHPVMWNIQGVRGQMSANCLWIACKAFFSGLFLFFIGTAMCVVGFYSDGVLGGSTSSSTNTNSTLEFGGRSLDTRDSARPYVRFSKLSYVGPIVMGVGGFIIVATCVMTFEARDSAAKVGPAAFGTTSNSTSTVFPLACASSSPRSKSLREVRSVGCQTQGTSSLTLSTLQLFDRKHIMEVFRKFSKTLRSSSSINSAKGRDQFHRSPSAPSLLSTGVQVRGSTSASALSNTRRFLHGGGGGAKGRRRVPPALRQAMSVDCSSTSTSSNPVPFLSVEGRMRRSNASTSTQTLTLPIQHQQQAPSPHSSRMALLSPRGIYRNVYSTSSECYPSSVRNSFCRGDTLEVPGSQTTLIFENESALQHLNVNASVHFNPADHHTANGLVTLNVMRGSCGGGSSTSLRTLSPHPSSCYSDDSFDRASAKSEQLSKSPVPSKPRFLSIEMSCKRPSLMRQSKVDYSEVVCLPDSDDEDSIIPEEEEDLSTIPE